MGIPFDRGREDEYSPPLGAAADQNPKYLGWDLVFDHNDRPDYILAEAQGAIVGEEVVRVASRIKHMSSEARIEAEERVVSCPARTPARDGTKVQQADSVNLRLGLILINQIAITAVSGEVVTDIYRNLRKVSPFTNTLMITIANDRIGYIIDDAAYDIPTFAATATPLQRGYAEGAIIHGLVEMMGQYL